jgi:L-lactate dehydrogenase complex protein LldG
MFGPALPPKACTNWSGRRKAAMSDTARERILARLFAAGADREAVAAAACMPVRTYSRAEKITRLEKLMSAVHTEVHVVRRQAWADALKQTLRGRGLKTLLYAPQSALGRQIEAAWQEEAQGLPALSTFEGSIEGFRDALFEIDAAITTTLGAIAETGALVLWPDQAEPRLMSLVPPVHIAVLEAEQIYNSFCELIQQQNWPGHMPTNALLISGPSKTADIEMTLAFGVHGPRELIVLVLED